MKKVFVKTGSYALLVALLAVFLFSCANPVLDSASGVPASAKSVVDQAAPALPPATATKYVLTAGAGNKDTIAAEKMGNAGFVYVWNDAVNLYVYYDTNDSADLLETHVWVGTDLTKVPQTPSDGGLKNGQFGNGGTYSPSQSSALVTIPLSGIQSLTSGTTLYIFAHAALTSGETAFAGTTRFPVTRWNFYMTYAYSAVSAETPKETISGYAFWDLNKNGSRDANEPGLAGVVVSIDRDGLPIATASDGFYKFENLAKEGYRLTAGGLAGYYHYSEAEVSATASATVNFAYAYEHISGFSFYDLNGNGLRDPEDPAIPNVTLSLSGGSPTTVQSGADGSYKFDHLDRISYTLSSAELSGFLRTTPASLTLTATAENANFGYKLDYRWMAGKTANGYTIGYWKTNIDKAIGNKTAGTQVTKANLLTYVGQLSSFALSPLNVATLDDAAAILGATGSAPSLLLSKQLMGSEFNYASGAYIGGNALVTAFFLYEGEYMLLNPGLFSSAQLLAQKDKYDAYNNTHGGALMF